MDQNTHSNQPSRWRKWGAIFGLSFALVGFGIYTYLAVDRSYNDLEHLSTRDLPLYNEIQALRTALIAVESTVYKYYLTAELVAFEEIYRLHEAQIESSLAVLDRPLNSPKHLDDLRHTYVEIQRSALAFKVVMTADSINWDDARESLAEFGPLTARAIAESEALSEWVTQRIVTRLALFEVSINRTLYLVCFLTFLAFVAAGHLAQTNYERLKLLSELERLASFPSSNPHPVLGLDAKGGILFANNAAERLGAGRSLHEILPNDIYSYLNRSSEYLAWEYERDGRHYTINLGFLEKYNEYHAFLSEITDRKKAEEHLEYLAYHDPVTGLLNRQQFNEFVDSYINDDDDALLLVALMDMDLLQKVVSSAGVSVAEKVARLAAIRLQHAITHESYFQQSCLSYIGGGLFCFAYPNDKIEADILFHKMRETISRPFDIDGFEFYLSLTIGVVSGEHICGTSSDNALRLADGALNTAKRDGGDQIVMYEAEIERRHKARIDIEMGLRHAQDDHEFELYYQPKIDLSTGTITGVEALLRWQHGEKGFISPADFIPIAEESGQILDIGEWVLGRACEDLMIWNVGREEKPVDVAINISAKQLLYGDVANTITRITKRFDVPVCWVELEITETAALTDFDRSLAKLEALSALGYRLSLDDFGTGYSSLNYLQRLPISSLKIDRAFVQELASGSRHESIAYTIVNLAHQLNFSVVAEGVETKEQLAMLDSWGCEYVQGYLLAKPMPLSDLMNFLNEFEMPVIIKSA